MIFSYMLYTTNYQRYKSRQVITYYTINPWLV